MASPLTVYSSTSDGHIFVLSDVYNTAWTTTSGNIGATSTFFDVGQYFDGDVEYGIYRGFVFFDTSSIPSSATITLVTLSVYGYIDFSATDFLMTVQNGQPTYPHNPLEAGDYDKVNYSNDGGSLTTVGFKTNGYNIITLNATGRGWVQKGAGAVTKLCLRSSLDIAGTTPTSDERVLVYASEQGVGYQPRLYVEYTGGGVSKKPSWAFRASNKRTRGRTAFFPDLKMD